MLNLHLSIWHSRGNFNTEEITYDELTHCNQHHHGIVAENTPFTFSLKATEHTAHFQLLCLLLLPNFFLHSLHVTHMQSHGGQWRGKLETSYMAQQSSRSAASSNSISLHQPASRASA